MCIRDRGYLVSHPSNMNYIHLNEWTITELQNVETVCSANRKSMETPNFLSSWSYCSPCNSNVVNRCRTVTLLHIFTGRDQVAIIQDLIMVKPAKGLDQYKIQSICKTNDNQTKKKSLNLSRTHQITFDLKEKFQICFCIKILNFRIKI